MDLRVFCKTTVLILHCIQMNYETVFGVMPLNDSANKGVHHAAPNARTSECKL